MPIEGELLLHARFRSPISNLVHRRIAALSSADGEPENCPVSATRGQKIPAHAPPSRRGGKRSRAIPEYRSYQQLLDSIRIFFTIFSEDLGWATGPDAEISRQEISATLERVLTQLIAAQENHYWVQICDVLEYEIVPILESWQDMVKRTHEHIS